MSVGAKRAVRVHVLIKGRGGQRWYDVQRSVKLKAGTTLAELIAQGERHGLPLAEALADSPHLAETMMLNGERCALEQEGRRVLEDGDRLYLLAPLAGG